MSADDDDDLLEAAPCGLLQTSDSGLVLRVNRTFCAWVGYTADDLIGRRRLQDLLVIGSRIFHYTHWAPLLQLQGSISEVKLELRHRDGSTVPMVLNARRRQRADTIVHDIAAYVARDRDRYERELVESRKRLEELVAQARELHAAARDRAQLAEQMIGIVSHDLRSPLSAILMGIELLGTETRPAREQHVVDRIRRSADRAVHLINDLLDFTQARLGRGITVSRSEIGLHAVVSETIDELRLAHPGRELRHAPHGDGACVADAARLAQVIVNLVSNAVAYGDPGAPVTVSSTIAASCSIAVHNQGPPIAPELQPSLFEPMTRGDTTGARARGVGLGLYIVREIARAHGGTVAVRSTDADGTTFEMAWPAA